MNLMTSPRWLAALLLLAPVAAHAQSQPAPEPTLRTGTQLVIVDVVVQDKDGNPVRGLKQDDFTLTEKKQPQTIRHFETHALDDRPQPGPSLGPLPPGTFTNYTPTPPSSTLNILLLDTLNTPLPDQAFVRQQLQQYVKKAPEGQRIAIFGLSSRLFLLQGFTSDVATLRDAVNHKLIPRSSSLLDDPAGTGVDQMKPSDMAQELADSAPAGGGGLAEVASNLKQFEAENAAFQTQLRIRYTLDAFNTLGHYLSAFPGRKNLIWFSGSFPINIMPDPDIQDPFSVMYTNDAEFRQTTNLLSRAQVAVYPVDARGLMVDPTFSAANSGASMRHPGDFAKATSKFAQSQAEEHMTMAQLADDTGGHAFYNTNDLATAVSKAINAGSNYYTLAYTPSDRKWDGAYRNIKVALASQLAAQGYKLSYRHGYYAEDPNDPKNRLSPAVTTESAQASREHGVTYAQASMSHGAPQPEDILFKVRVLPSSNTTDDKLAEGNQVDPVHPMRPPYRRFFVDFAVLNNGMRLERQPDGKFTGKLSFSAYVFDNEGKLLDLAGKAVGLNLTFEQYKNFLSGTSQLRLEVSAPVRGDNFLRVGGHDEANNSLGAVEVPLSTVARLAPLPEPPAKPAGVDSQKAAPAAPAKPQ